MRRAKLQLRNLKHERDEKDTTRWWKLSRSSSGYEGGAPFQEYSQRAAVKLKIERERQEKLAEQKAFSLLTAGLPESCPVPVRCRRPRRRLQRRSYNVRRCRAVE